MNNSLAKTSLFLLLILSLPLIAGSYLYLDKPIAIYFHHMHLTDHWPWLTWVTDAGKGTVYVALFFFLMLFFRWIYPDIRKEMQSRLLLLCILIPNTICFFFKAGLGRARPELFFQEGLYGFYGLSFNKLFWSFPSSHTSTIVGLIIGICLIFPRYFIPLLLAGFVVISSRIILYQHYLSDILTAIILTCMELGILVYCLRGRTWFAIASTRK